MQNLNGALTTWGERNLRLNGDDSFVVHGGLRSSERQASRNMGSKMASPAVCVGQHIAVRTRSVADV